MSANWNTTAKLNSSQFKVNGENTLLWNKTESVAYLNSIPLAASVFPSLLAKITREHGDCLRSDNDQETVWCYPIPGRTTIEENIEVENGFQEREDDQHRFNQQCELELYNDETYN